MRAVQPSKEEQVKLNVGGVRFETSWATLTKVPGSMLATMFGARQDMLRRDPEDGSIFLDRDGERFGLVLDFLRNPGEASHLAKTIRELPSDDDAYDDVMSRQESLLRELDFFGLAKAVFPPRPWRLEDAQFKAWGGTMTHMRIACAAVLHGRSVVVFGGYTWLDDGVTTNTTEVLDLDATTGESFYTAGPPMTTERQGCAAVRLDERRVLVIGGSEEANPYGPSLDTTEILDLETMRFSAGPRMLARRLDCAAVAIDAGRVLVAGGGHNASALRTTEILDLATMTFTPGPEMFSGRRGCAAVALLSEGNPRRALIVGGCGPDDENLSTTEVFDLETMTFSRGPTMRSARWACAAVLLPPADARGERRCLVVGGRDDDEDEVKTTEVLDLETMKFSDGPAMLVGRAGCAAVSVGDDVVVLGGIGHFGDHDGQTSLRTEVLDSEGAAWRPR